MMREFTYYSFHIPSGTRHSNTVECFNEVDFFTLLAHWNYKGMTMAGKEWAYYPQTPPQIHDIPVGDR